MPRPGWRRIDVMVAAPDRSAATFSAGTLDADGREHPFSAAEVLVSRASRARMTVDRIARLLSLAIDGVMLLFLGLSMVGGRTVTQWLWLVVLADALLFARPWVGRVMVLDGGGDPLTYETYARDILLHGPLMTVGHPVGAGEPFYYQPLYPYVLAALHVVGGEGFFAILFVQRLLIGVSIALVWQMTRRLFGDRVGRVGLVVAAAFLYVRAHALASMLLGENVFIPLVCAWVVLAIRYAERGTATAAVWTGVAGGLATLSRSTLVLAWPVVTGLTARARRRTGGRVAAVALMSVVMIGVVSTATLRNWVVARQFVPITTSFAINFYLGNQPPAALDTHGVAEFGIYRWIGRDDLVRKVLEFAVHAPGAFARNLARKALYALGFFGAYVPGTGFAPALIACWVAALCGGWLAARRPLDPAPPSGLRWLPAGVALTHFAAVVAIFPHVYGDRLILPMYVLMLPYAARACAAIVPSARRAP